MWGWSAAAATLLIIRLVVVVVERVRPAFGATYCGANLGPHRRRETGQVDPGSSDVRTQALEEWTNLADLSSGATSTPGLYELVDSACLIAKGFHRQRRVRR